MRSVDTAMKSSDVILFNNKKFSQNLLTFVDCRIKWKNENSWFYKIERKVKQKIDSRNQQMLTKFFVEKYDISAFHSRVNRPHMFLKTNPMKLWTIIIFSIFSWFWKILIFMEKFKLTRNHYQISQKDGWHEFRKLRHHSFWQKIFGQHLLTSSIHIFVLKFPWDCQKWHFFDISFGFWVNKSQQILAKMFVVEKYDISAF